VAPASDPPLALHTVDPQLASHPSSHRLPRTRPAAARPARTPLASHADQRPLALHGCCEASHAGLLLGERDGDAGAGTSQATALSFACWMPGIWMRIFTEIEGRAQAIFLLAK